MSPEVPAATGKVSIVIPAYNARDYIAACLRSIEKQTYKNVEVIVVDDGSTDGTSDLIKQSFSQVRLFRTGNKGPAAARNLGIAQVTGEFVAFIDTDDQWRVEKLAKQVRYLKEHPGAQMVITDNHFVAPDGSLLKTTDKEKTLIEGDVVNNIFAHSEVCTPTVMVRSTVFERVGVFREELTTCEDDNLWMRIAEHSEVGLIAEPLADIQVRPDSSSRGRQGLENLYEGNLLHLRLLKSDYPTIYRRIRKHLKTKIRQIHFSYAYGAIFYGDIKKARRALSRALVQGDFSIRVAAYFILSLLGLSAVRKAQRAFGVVADK